MSETKYNIIVVEDSERHIKAAEKLLGNHTLTICRDFDSARNTLQKMKSDAQVLLTDLFFPHGEAYPLSGELAREPQALGFPLALYASSYKVPYIGILTDANHHKNAVVAACDDLEYLAFQSRKSLKIDQSNLRYFTVDTLPSIFELEDGSLTDPSIESEQPQFYHLPRVKNWKAALERLVHEEQK